MGLFSRRKKDDDAPDVEPASVSSAASEEAVEDPTPPDVPASMTISVSAFQGVGAAAPPVAPPDEGATQTETAPSPGGAIAGLRDNTALRVALAALSEPPAPEQVLEVARQLMQGHLFLRVQGDARALLAAGDEVPTGVATVQGEQYVLAYSGGAALRASLATHDQPGTSAMGQPVLAVLCHVLDGPYGGLILDHSSAPASAMLPRNLLQKMVDQADDTLELKTVLAGERTDATAPAVAELLTRTKIWVAVNRSAEGRLGVAEARTTDGARLIEVYSHPLEVSSMRRDDQPAPMAAAQLAAALRADADLSGVIVDPAGPWIRLTRDDLAPLIALAP